MRAQEAGCVSEGLSREEKLTVINLFNSGRLAETEEQARNITKRFPEELFGWSVLGTLFLQQGQSHIALPYLEKAASLCPDVSDIHNNCGLALADLGRLDEALASYQKALERNPASVMALTNRGSALEAAGRPEEAAASYNRALQIDPDHVKARYNLGNTLRDLGRLEEAATCYCQALAGWPDYVYARTNLGLTLFDLGRLEEAEACVRQALALQPDLAPAVSLLAALLLVRHGDAPAALDMALRSLRLDPRPETRSLVVACLRQLPPDCPAFADASLRETVVAALTEPWARPGLLTGVAARLATQGGAVGECLARVDAAWPRRLGAEELFGPAGPGGCADPLLCRLLEAAPVCTLELERFLTMTRHILLETAIEEKPYADVDPDALGFYSALARQCFINEYVFAVTGDEARAAEDLRDRLVAAMEAGRVVPASWLVAVAAYYPLHGLPLAADRLLAAPWPEAAAAVLTQQLREPGQERDYRPTIPRLTAIEDTVSRLVRRQYEQSPYPRWITAAPPAAPVTLDAFLRRRFPLASLHPYGKRDGLDVLVAGCGTGQHSLETARRFAKARVLAVDLSLSSLCYAKRKTRELGLTTAIDYAQADILQLGAIGQRFDVIESCGVLHHLADPLAGWEVLLSLLRPGGCMRLGLYSRMARRNITRTRALILAKGYAPTVEDIRRCRQDLLAVQDSLEGNTLLMSDFFSSSGCRDLLFNVQECCMTLVEIGAFLARHSLRFLGFDLDAPVLEAYRRRFPEDASATDLARWHDFEAENPDTFIEMYQFWVQKPPRQASCETATNAIL